MSSDALQDFITGQTQLFAHGLPNAPILNTPADEGLEYEDVTFPSYLDNVALEGWFIPAKGSNKLIICNHPMTFNRSGFPGKVGPYAVFQQEALSFIPDYKILHDAGYNVLAYDLRNHGRSGSGWGSPRVMTYGHYESRDVVGSILYARSRPDTGKMEVALYSRCFGADSTIRAFAQYPEYFKDIKTLLALQPVSIETFIERGAKNAGLDVAKAVKGVDEAVRAETGYYLKDWSPQNVASAVNVPTFVLTVRDDAMINAPKDLQEIYDNLGTKDKKIYWIEGTTQRFDGYTFFAREPQMLVDWFKKYL